MPCGSVFHRVVIRVCLVSTGSSVHSSVPRKSPSKYSMTSRRPGSKAITRSEKRTAANRRASGPPMLTATSTTAPVSGRGASPRWRIDRNGCHHWLRPAASSRRALTISAGVAAMAASVKTSYVAISPPHHGRRDCLAGRHRLSRLHPAAPSGAVPVAKVTGRKVLGPERRRQRARRSPPSSAAPIAAYRSPSRVPNPGTPRVVKGHNGQPRPRIFGHAPTLLARVTAAANGRHKQRVTPARSGWSVQIAKLGCPHGQ